MIGQVRTLPYHTIHIVLQINVLNGRSTIDSIDAHSAITGEYHCLLFSTLTNVTRMRGTDMDKCHVLTMRDVWGWIRVKVYSFVVVCVQMCTRGSVSMSIYVFV